MTNENKKFYIAYLRLLIKLNRLHSTHWTGRTLETPTLISENICRALLGLEDREKGEKDHDAQLKGEKYEIKATSDAAGTTTYNPSSQVEYFVWIFFDYTNEELVIKQTKRNNILTKNVIDEENDTQGTIKKGRTTIQLSKVQWDSERVFCMKTLKELKKENADEKGKI